MNFVRFAANWPFSFLAPFRCGRIGCGDQSALYLWEYLCALGEPSRNAPTPASSSSDWQVLLFANLTVCLPNRQWIRWIYYLDYYLWLLLTAFAHILIGLWAYPQLALLPDCTRLDGHLSKLETVLLGNPKNCLQNSLTVRPNNNANVEMQAGDSLVTIFWQASNLIGGWQRLA